jgi:hypothetical protein
MRVNTSKNQYLHHLIKPPDIYALLSKSIFFGKLLMLEWKNENTFGPAVSRAEEPY